jgi:hypothetical protein
MQQKGKCQDEGWAEDGETELMRILKLGQEAVAADSVGEDKRKKNNINT